ncbi:hypothetical protein M5585_14110 [Serratia ureilytica]
MSKGLPTLVLWTPSPRDKTSGVLHVFNIELLSNFYSSRRSLTFSAWC